jgi:O-acetyl-ADP-ribose deacetylase (regulator of RNase III)
MEYEEIKKDLFSASEDYYLAHCISSDFVMGGGIAVPFNKKFNLKAQFRKIKKENPAALKHPTCILLGRVFNLITKNLVFHKPTYETMRSALEKMKEICDEEGIKKIAMPRIGSGIDGLDWIHVREIVCDVFDKSEVEILVCYI